MCMDAEREATESHPPPALLIGKIPLLLRALLQEYHGRKSPSRAASSSVVRPVERGAQRHLAGRRDIGRPCVGWAGLGWACTARSPYLRPGSSWTGRPSALHRTAHSHHDLSPSGRRSPSQRTPGPSLSTLRSAPSNEGLRCSVASIYRHGRHRPRSRPATATSVALIELSFSIVSGVQFGRQLCSGLPAKRHRIRAFAVPDEDMGKHCESGPWWKPRGMLGELGIIYSFW